MELEWPQDWNPQRDLTRIRELLGELEAKTREIKAGTKGEGSPNTQEYLADAVADTKRAIWRIGNARDDLTAAE